MSISLTKQLITKGNCGTVTELVDVISVTSCGFVTVIKVIIPRVYHAEMNVIVNSVINDWNTVNNKRYRLIMLKYAYIGRVVFIVQMIGAYAAEFPLIIYKLPFIMSLWSNDQNDSAPIYTFPIGPSCWVSSDISMIYYILYYICLSIQLTIACTAYFGVDTYFFGIAIHVCGQFTLLSHSLDHVYSNGDVVIQKYEFSLFIKRHKHLLLLANNFEKTYNLIILSQVAIDTLLICISGIVLLMTMHTRDLVVIIGLIIRINIVYVQLFIYCYVGEQLHTQAEKMGSTVYNCLWYNMSPKVTKDIAFMIMRTNYSFNLTAGKMYSMNIENYKNIVKTMASFFSVLRLMFIENE
ncbi:odorant receptor 13a-like [Cotesia typhae]|uniref:odorant receptor 13a-like n=1 Tax=Cotesia typhae TaxID=2053667 RepID=UPI003D68F948